MEKQITILTEPITFKSKLKRLVKRILGRQVTYGGHYAVTRSLVEGLNKIGYKGFNYRPKSERELADHVHVLAGVETLRYAIGLKKAGKIKRLTAGPNVVVFSTDYDSLIADDAIDLYLQPSQWAADLHIKLEPKMERRCLSWPAGIDMEAYKVANSKRDGKKVLIYHKDESDQFCYRVDYLLRKNGYTPTVVRYGHYKLEEYIKTLSECSFCVVIARQESQGIYLAEAWAMDVPTICFEPHYYKWKYGDFAYEEAENISTCPYLTEKTGCTFMELSELEEILRSMDTYRSKFAPREWVLENMTDEVCAKAFLRCVGILN